MLGRKEPGEVYPFTYDFRDQLGADGINAISEVLVEARQGGAALTNEGQIHAGGLVTVYWGGGVDGESYLTTVRITSDAAALFEMGGEILVRERAFQVPDFQTAYLSSDEYVERFGREETIRLTDESRLGNIDEGKLRTAIVDATELTEGYLRNRYDLPLASVPSNIKGIVAALAREFLHRSRPLEAVTASADRARSLLRDISAGRLVLALETGEELEGNGAGLAVWGPSADARVFNAEKLDRF